MSNLPPFTQRQPIAYNKKAEPVTISRDFARWLELLRIYIDDGFTGLNTGAPASLVSGFYVDAPQEVMAAHLGENNIDTNFSPCYGGVSAGYGCDEFAPTSEAVTEYSTWQSAPSI